MEFSGKRDCQGVRKLVEKAYYYVSSFFNSFFFAMLTFPLTQLFFLPLWGLFFVGFILLDIFKFKVGENVQIDGAEEVDI